MLKFESPKKWFAKAHEYYLNGGYACFKARLTLKFGWNGRESKVASYPRSWRTYTKIIEIFDIGIRIIHKMVSYSTRKLFKWAVCSPWGSFDLENGSDWPWGPPGCVAKFLTDVQNFFGIFDVVFGSPKKWFAIAHEKLSQIEVCALQGSFELEIGLDWPWDPTGCISKVFTDV